MDLVPEVIAQGSNQLGETIINNDFWKTIKTQGHDD
jgi:hypothetical protein